MSVQCTADNPCVAMQLLTQRAVNQEERIDKMELLIESMRNRLPLWATMALTACGGTIGILVGLLTKG
ncbi:MAG: hypothetical protein Q8911_00100 [Bacillota bacterium]|nr:hypothetical protein [Bacillota bacterium]